MKIEIDTNKDSYDIWKEMQKLVESAYREPVRKLIVTPGGKKREHH